MSQDSTKEEHEGLNGNPNDNINGNDDRGQKVGLRERLRHFTWAWFTATMGTGGVSIVIAEQPHTFRGLHTIGVIVFILNMVLFLLLCTAMTARFTIDRRRFLHSFSHPGEMFFFGSFLLSIAVILGGIQLYGITYGPSSTKPWLVDAIHALYWIYAAFSLINSILLYWTFMQRTPMNPIPINPSWFLPGYSAMLTGTVASLIASSQPPSRRMPIIVSGLAYQGLGWMWSFILIGMDFMKMMEQGLPPPSQRPGMFIPVGSVSYTILVIIGLSSAIPRDYGYFAAHPSAADTLQALSLFISIFLWLSAFWLFSIATLSCVVCIGKMTFSLPWWAFIFPNVGFTIATIMIGRELGSGGVLWVASGMSVALVAVWLFTIGACVYGVVKRRVLWPGMDEDKDM